MNARQERILAELKAAGKALTAEELLRRLALRQKLRRRRRG